MTARHAALDVPTRGLVELAAAIAQGIDETIRGRVEAAVAASVPPVWVEELLLQSVLMVGWPRTLVAAGIWREAAGAPTEAAAQDLAYEGHVGWTERGKATCQLVYGDFYDRLRANVRALHPALDAWMVTEGYGRTLSRPGLSFKVREFCVIAQTAVLDTPRQLYSHLRGAMHASAGPDEIDAVFTEARSFVPDAQWHRMVAVWHALRDRPDRRQ